MREIRRPGFGELPRCSFRRGPEQPAPAHTLFPIFAVGGAASSIALLMTSIQGFAPLLLWNASPSSPIGLYQVERASDARRGDFAIARLPDGVSELAAKRHYLPLGVPLVKHVAAIAGDRVCASRDRIFVNGGLQAIRRSADLAGRPLPSWSGCEKLGKGDLFLLSPNVPDAFDGRYFGITRPADVVGKAELLWQR